MNSITNEELKSFFDSSSRTKAEQAALVAEKSQRNFDKFVKFALQEPYPVSMRASWAMVICCEKNPYFIEKHFGICIQKLPELNSTGVRRNFLTILANQNIPEEWQGELLNHCFDFVLSPNEPVAVKTNALQIIANHIRHYPELKNEIKVLIENQRDKNSVAFWAKGKNILKTLK